MKITTSWKDYLEKGAEVVSEGIVMLKNDNKALPLAKTDRISVFGRMQLHYYKSGSGSGGMVNVYSVTGILEGLREAGADINEKLLDIYKNWDGENPIKTDGGWGQGFWSQEEMPLSDDTAAEAAANSDAAIVVIARTSGEEIDMQDKEGSFRLTAGEKSMLAAVRRHFKRMIVVLNTCSVIDMTGIEGDSILMVWQGGMTGGTGTARVLFGRSPCGKLPDTVTYSAADHPSYHDYSEGMEDLQCIYDEDIYVGYRYFETFARDKVLYPFGFGLSYTDFAVTLKAFSADDKTVRVIANVKNIGGYEGKETVQVYCEAPLGKLGKAARVLCGYKKTALLPVGGDEDVVIEFDTDSLSSYDDSGVTGHRFCYLLEEGTYTFYVGTDCRAADKAGELTLAETRIVKQCSSTAAPVKAFKRIKNSGGSIAYEDVPLMSYDETQRRLEGLPEEIAYTGDKGLKLADVESGKFTMDEFIAQLNDEDLAAIIRGEGMGSPKVTPGTAAAFGGVTDSLKSLGVPCACCDDGPSGMRLDCGDKAFSLPIGTMLAATFNDELVTELYSFTGREMASHNVEALLGPGMNIHRDPLNGRNFEYFSEDPLLTGNMGAAVLKGLKSADVSGTVKHYCANNRETHRHELDSVVSERALREIYLRGFEIAVRSGHCDSVMSTYGSLNGLWTAGNYSICTEILRGEWGFTGIVMTDWWADMNRRGGAAERTDLAAMAKAQNDIYMVVPDSATYKDNVISALDSGDLKRSELQRNAKNILTFVMKSRAFARLAGTADEYVFTDLPEAQQTPDGEDLPCYKVGESLTIPADNIPTEKGTEYIFLLEPNEFSKYHIALTASSDASETAQIPVTLFCMGSPAGTFVWNGTNGRDVTFGADTFMFPGYASMRLYFAQSGLKLKEITVKKVKEG